MSLTWDEIEKLKTDENDVFLVLRFTKTGGNYYPAAVFFNIFNEGTKEVLPKLCELLGVYTKRRAE